MAALSVLRGCMQMSEDGDLFVRLPQETVARLHQQTVLQELIESTCSVMKEEQMTQYDVGEYQGCLGQAPILDQKHYDAPSVFTPENLLREARRQKGVDEGNVPAICVLDPDGDLVDYLHGTDCACRHATWACYHTVLHTFVHEGVEYGIIGRVVGAPFAVLVAEELFASGCKLLISLTSAGQIFPVGRPPYVILIEQALRDEGTSYHYLPPSLYSSLHPVLREVICANWDHTQVPLAVGASWTTDAPFRETEEAIAACHAKGILAVEMEAAALYALGSARQKEIVCFAHVTNQMGQTEGDFEKGQAQGSVTLLQVLRQTARAWQTGQPS